MLLVRQFILYRLNDLYVIVSGLLGAAEANEPCCGIGLKTIKRDDDDNDDDDDDDDDDDGVAVMLLSYSCQRVVHCSPSRCLSQRYLGG
jgi:hypothetical protein